jgi:hypothetical protein
MFQQPSQGDRLDMKDLLGSLVLIWVRELREGIPTPYGEREAIAADVHVLDGAKGGEKFENSLIFQAALIGSLRGAAGGDPVLGRIGQGVAKPGQSPPFILQPYTEQDAALATGYIQRMPKPFQPAANGQPAEAAASPPTANPAQPAGAIDYTALPPEVLELLRQAGQLPAS